MIVQADENTSLLVGKAHQTGDAPAKTITARMGFALCINMIIGTGVFNLPYSFSNSGLVLGTLVLVTSAIFGVITLMWFVETLARSEGVQTALDTPGAYPEHKLTYRKWDLVTMAQLYGGRWLKIAVQVAIQFYAWGVLWAYAAVFGSSVAALFWQFALQGECDIYGEPSFYCSLTYYIVLLLFAIIVVPLALMNVGEQATMQLVMTVYRFSAFAVMFVTLVIGLAYGSNPNVTAPVANSTVNGTTPTPPLPDPNAHAAYTDLLAWSGFAGVFSTAAVALNFHWVLPEIVQPLQPPSRQHVRGMAASALLVAASFYLLFGLLGAVFFGSNTYPLATLNWASYTGRLGGWGGPLSDRLLISYFVQFWVMLFPVLDMLSIFPMVGISLGNNLAQFAPDAFKDRFGPRSILIVSRLLATVPPLIAAGALGKINHIFDISGLFAFFLQIFFPAALQLLSRRLCARTWGIGSWITPFSIPVVGSTPMVWVTILFGIAAFTFSFLTLVAPSLVKEL